MQPAVADWCCVGGCGRALCVCGVCVCVVCVCGGGRGVTTTNLPPLAAHQTLPPNSCLRLPRAVGPRLGTLLLPSYGIAAYVRTMLVVTYSTLGASLLCSSVIQNVRPDVFRSFANWVYSIPKRLYTIYFY